MYEIYINERKLTLCKSSELDAVIKKSKSLVARYNGKPNSFFNYIDMMEKGTELEQIVIHGESKKELVNDFNSLFGVVKAGGGLVINEKNEVLFIFRKGSWDLPKGKLDPGETKQQGALREVMEETGVSEVKIVRKLCKTRHSFRNKLPRRQIKKTHWYIMTTHSQELIPETAEDITKAEWMTLEKFFSKERKVYRSILDVLKKYKLSLAQELV